MHNSITPFSDGDFTIPSTVNRALAGTYTVSLKGYVQQPDDYTVTTFTEKAVNYDFNIVMVDPCATTTLDAFTVNDMWTAVHGAADVQVLS